MTTPEPTPADGSRATIYTVAEQAGVSRQTVARFLRGERLRPGNQERVEQALEQLDYRVNDTARELATRNLRRIGALVFDVDDWAPQRVLAGAMASARSAGFMLETIRVDVDDTESIRRAAAMIASASLAGVVVLAPPDFVAAELRLSRLRVPWLVEVEPEIPVGDPVMDEHPVARAVRHLADLGHERFFHLGGPVEWASGRGRHTAFHETVRSLDLKDCGATAGPWGPATGYEAMDQYPWDSRPTAIVAASDQIALGALSWLHEHDYDVPRDVSITGLDGLRDAAYYAPALTTMAVDFVAMGERAVGNLLAGRQLRRRPTPEEYAFVSELVVRQSTGHPGDGLVRRGN